MKERSPVPSLSSVSSAAIALNRFGLGARPNDTPPANPQRWLLDQFAHFDVLPAAYATLEDAGTVIKRYEKEQVANRQMTGQENQADIKVARHDFRQDVQTLYRAAVQARTDSALATETPFVERLVHFWSNHFCVSADNPRVTAFVGAFERDAIRPHVLGRFADMALAAEQHPAMLIYLNQIQSIGPDSNAAARNPERKRGLNENLAREIMELHTLGVRSGYTQADVTEFARALTGWSVGGLGADKSPGADPNNFMFRPGQHEPGVRTILGKRYDQDGENQARAVLFEFAHSPATAIHIATKLARHFAGDVPPPALVERLATSFTTSHGDLPTVYRTLVASREAWVAVPTKFKTPWEWTISALRGTGRAQVGNIQIAGLQTQLGQRIWQPGSPAGWDDIAASWAGSGALLARVEVAQRLGSSIGAGLDARTVAPRIMPGSLSDATADQIARSESAAGAIALMLVSPDFLRR
jgi:uncharacterized protein (DUF1800 family)